MSRWTNDLTEYKETMFSVLKQRVRDGKAYSSNEWKDSDSSPDSILRKPQTSIKSNIYLVIYVNIS